MTGTRFVVGFNDNRTYYEVVHIDSCSSGQQIGCRRRFFTDYEEARAHATEHRAGQCCKSRIERIMGRDVA